jgi:transposase InsO family protein
VEQAQERYKLSERHACRLLGQWRGTQRYTPMLRSDEHGLTRAIITLASQYGRYGYRQITALLQGTGLQVGEDRVQRIWRREGLKVPQKQKPRGRLWLNDGSCVRLRPERANHVWSYDFVSAVTHDGRALHLLTLIDEYTRECLAVHVARRSTQVAPLARSKAIAYKALCALKKGNFYLIEHQEEATQLAKRGRKPIDINLEEFEALCAIQATLRDVDRL